LQGTTIETVPTYEVRTTYKTSVDGVIDVVGSKPPLFVQKSPILTYLPRAGTSNRFTFVSLVFGQCSLGIGFVVFV
jgi:hypothetical protein